MKSGRSTTGEHSAGAALHVNGYSANWLRQGFPWVYPAEVVGRRPASGATVQLVAPDGGHLGMAIAGDGWIAARRFRSDAGKIDAPWIRARVLAAARRRQGLPAETDAFRVVHAENDDLPGVRVDAYAGHLVITLDSPSLDALVPAIADAAREALAAPSSGEISPVATAERSVHLAYRHDPRETAAAAPAGRLLSGTAPAGDVLVRERGMAMLARLGAGKDVGLFTDMRDNRAWLQPHWRERRVLNLFSYTGAFSVAAARGGAAEVVSVDLAEAAHERARANVEANGLDPGVMAWWAEDAWKALDRLRRKEQRFDLVLADPPGHAHGPGGGWSGESDWPRLVAAMLRVLRPGGWIACASNLGSQSPRQFHQALQAGARKAGMALHAIHDGGTPLDHPAALHFPEGRYLKFVVSIAEAA
jgi:23S rRNA (cytosine1962-C5)-methyltransferase